MADEPEVAPLPQAVVTRKKRLRISIIWIIPLLAALVAIGIAVQRLRAEGPTITIVLKEANGVEAGKTFIRYKDVRIGLVTAVELSEDYTKVLVKAKIAKHAAGLMVQDAQFWVVEPRISLSGVSGLNTLLSGNYIGFQAGKSTESQTLYFAMDEPPIITDQPGRKFVLKADTLGSLGIGTSDLLSAAQRRPGRGLHAHARRAFGRDRDLRQRALRQVRDDGDALLERQRRQHHARRGRLPGAHGVARGAARGRDRLRCPRLRPNGREAGAGQYGVHVVQVPCDRDEGAYAARAALRAVLQRVGARAVGRGAGDALRHAGR
jgi:hypothetical protein